MNDYKNPIEIRILLEHTVIHDEEIMCTKTAARIFIKAFSITNEEFLVLSLNKQNEPILISSFKVNSSEKEKISIKEVLRLPISVNANAIQIGRFVDSNNLQASVLDIELANEIKTLSKIVGIQCFDYMLVGYNNWLSLVKENIMK